MQNSAPVILLFGMPRSGTTWIGKIFDSHPHTVYRGEPERQEKWDEMPVAPGIERTAELRPLVEQYVSRLHLHATLNRLVFRKDYYSPMRWQLYRAGMLLGQAAIQVNWRPVIPTLIPRGQVASVPVVWKSVASMGRLGVIARSLENRKAVLLLRHPCGQVSSMIRGEQEELFRDGSQVPVERKQRDLTKLLESAPGRRRGLTLQDFAKMTIEERFAWRWVLFNEKMIEDTDGVDGCVQVRYEDVCGNPLRKMAEVFAFCGLAWNEQTENFVRRSTTVSNNRYFSVFKNPLESVCKWQNELTPEQIERIYGIVRQSDLIRLYPAPETVAAGVGQ